MDTFVEEKKQSEKDYKLATPFIYTIIKFGFIWMLIRAFANIKDIKGVGYFIFFVLVGYFTEQIMFGAGHLWLHSQFPEMTKNGTTALAHYHHFRDAGIYEQYPNYHRGSYFCNIEMIFIITVLFFLSNYVIFWSFMFFFMYDILCHEYYHVRDRDNFYKTNGFREFVISPNEFDISLIQVGITMGIHDRERHRGHHIKSISSQETEWDDWDDLFLFGKVESYIKNTYYNFVNNNFIKDSEYRETLSTIHFIFITLILFGIIKVITNKFSFDKIDKHIGDKNIFDFKSVKLLKE